MMKNKLFGKVYPLEKRGDQNGQNHDFEGRNKPLLF
jgi:hypothetical protein